ncbi:MAG: mechanosensitive ion channel family protein [Symploca sp. SIO2B6]|nr:mechanosensitive ion channel family protein [Symploca sp. SIO2B6]
MKRWPDFIIKIISVLIIILALQGGFTIANASLSPIAPPPTQSPRATYSAFLRNTNDAHTLILEAYQKSQSEGGLWASREVLDLAKQAKEAMERVTRTMDLQNFSQVNRASDSTEFALMLREILDRVELPDIDSIPDLLTVEEEGLTRWEIPKTQIAIIKLTDGFYKDEFLFSEETLKRIPHFYKEMASEPYLDDALEGFYDFYVSTPGSLLPPKWSQFLPKWSKKMLGNQTIWQWGSLFLLLGLTIAVIRLVYRIIGSHQGQSDSRLSAWEGLILPAAIALTLLISLFLVREVINITGNMRVAISLSFETLIYVSLAWLGFMFLNALGRQVISNAYFDDDRLLEATIIRNGFRVLGVIVATTCLYLGGEQVGLPTGPLVASLGIGGLAISFGVQPYLTNLIGGITLFANRPVKIGEFCEVGGVTGIIEDIGLRSTAVRTIDRSVVMIPNSVVSESQVINYSRRDRRLLQFSIGLRYETNRQQVVDIIDKIKGYIQEQPILADERVRFTNFGDSSLDIEIYTYVLTTAYAEFLEVKERLLLQIMAIVEVVGSDFAFPSQTLYMSQDSGISEGTPMSIVGQSSDVLD